MSGEGGLHLNAALPSSPLSPTDTVAEGTPSWSNLDLGLEDSVIDSSLDVACGSTIGEVGSVAASDFAHVEGTGKSSGEPTVPVDSGVDPGCGDATPGESAAAPANDEQDALTLEGVGVDDVAEATVAPTGCVIGEVDAGHTIEAVWYGSAHAEGVPNGSGGAVIAGATGKRGAGCGGAGCGSAGAATETGPRDSGLGDVDDGLPTGSSVV